MPATEKPLKSFPSGSAVESDGLLLDSGDEEPSSPSPERQMQCQVCFRLFPSQHSLSGHMRVHSKKKSMSEQTAARQVQALQGDDGSFNLPALAPVKRKRTPRVPMEFTEQRQVQALDNDAHVRGRDMPARGRRLWYWCNLCNQKFPASVQEEEVERNASDLGLIGDAELEKPTTPNSDEEIKCGDLSVDVKANVCSQAFRSGQALGGHKECHYVPSCGHCDQQKQKHEMLDLNLPPLAYGVSKLCSV